MNRVGIWGALSLALAVIAVFLYTGNPPPAYASHLCGNTGSSQGPFDLQTYEATDWRTTYGRTYALAGFNRLFPDVSGFALPRLETGGRSAGSGQLRDPYIPPTLLKAIAWIESSWSQADSSVAYGAVGPVLVSHDCGYGLMQITSGMQNVSGVPDLEQAMIGGHYASNIARGARILAEKWNAAPEFRPIVGNRDPKIVEDWYYAVWSYNGFTFKNHPRNPDYSLTRARYRCDGSQPRSSYPYQELVFGCMANPPVVSGQALWSPLAVRLPSLSDPGFSLSRWDACSINRDCAAMDLATPSSSLTSDSSAVSWGDGRIDVFARGSGDRLWHRWYIRGQGWSVWETLGGVLNSGPGVSSWAEGRLDVFALGTDNKLKHKWYIRGQGWFPNGPWENLGAPPGLSLTSDPSAVSWGDGRVDVFARASDDGLWHRWYIRGQGWSGWEPLGGVLNSGPDVSSWGEGRLDVLVRGADNRLHHKWYIRGRGWSGWERLGAPSGLSLTSDPGAVSWGDGRIDVFARASDDGLWHRWYVGGQGWSGWEPLGGVLNSGPDVSSWGDGQLDVFALGTDNKLRHKWYTRGQGWFPRGLWENLGALSSPTKDSTTVNLSRSQVIGAPTLSVSPASFTLTAGTPASITVSNAGTGPLVWRATTSAAWLKVSKVQGVSQGTDIGSQASTITISVGANALPLGTYSGEITIESLYASGAPVKVQVTIVSLGVSARIDVFARASDDGLWHRWYVGGQGWSGWEPLGGNLGSGPDVSSWAEGRLDVFALGTDNKLRHKWYVRGQGWFPQGPWENLGAPSGLSLTSDPGAVSWLSGGP